MGRLHMNITSKIGFILLAGSINYILEVVLVVNKFSIIKCINPTILQTIREREITRQPT